MGERRVPLLTVPLLDRSGRSLARHPDLQHWHFQQKSAQAVAAALTRVRLGEEGDFQCAVNGHFSTLEGGGTGASTSQV